MIKLNKTPVRTSRNFNINNIKLENVDIPDKVQDFDNLEILGKSSKLTIQDNVSDFNLEYGLGDILTNHVKEKSNKKIRLTIDNKNNEELYLNFKFDNNNLQLIDNIEIIANEDTKSTIIIKYESDKKINAFHNGIINLIAKSNSQIDIILVNLLNNTSNNFISIQNKLDNNSKVRYTVVDFGGKNSITNYYSNLIGDCSENILNTIYLGKDNQLFDLNYIVNLRGKKSNVDIEVKGALKDDAKKHFKGTIDFKKGCKKSKGNENESCMLLSDTAKSLALPMLLCSEEDVEGNHSTSSGKAGEKELFYIMSRGFELKEALKLMVKAKFNKILENIKNEELKNKIIDEIDLRLD